MAPNSIVSAHNVLSTVPVHERYLSTCFMPPANLQPDKISFRVFVKGSLVYEGRGSQALPTCVRVQFPQTLETGDQVRVQALHSGGVLAEDVYVHEDIGVLQKAAGAVEGITSSIGQILSLAVLGFLLWLLLSGRKSESGWS